MSITLPTESVQVWTAILSGIFCIVGVIWFLVSLDKYSRRPAKVISLTICGVGIALGFCSNHLYQQIQTAKYNLMSPEWASLYEKTKNITTSDNVTFARLKFVSQNLDDGKIAYPTQTVDQMELMIDLLTSGERSRHLAPKVYEVFSPYIHVSKDGIGQSIE